MTVYALQRPGRRNLGIYSSIESAKNAARNVLMARGYSEVDDDYYWEGGNNDLTCYSNKYIDQPENDLYKITAVEVDTTYAEHECPI